MYGGKTAAPMRCGALVSAYKIQQMSFFLQWTNCHKNTVRSKRSVIVFKK